MPERPGHRCKGDIGWKRWSSLEDRTYGRLERVVTALVEAGLDQRLTVPPNLVERLRALERSELASKGARQTLQVIASGRRLLGGVVEPDRFRGIPYMDVMEGQR